MKPQIILVSQIPHALKIEYVGEPNFAGHQERWLTTQQAADYLQIHKVTLLRFVRMKKIPFVPLPGAGHDFRFMKAVLDQWGRNRSLGHKK